MKYEILKGTWDTSEENEGYLVTRDLEFKVN